MSWRPWANACKPGTGAAGVRSTPVSDGHGARAWPRGAGRGTCWFSELRPDDTFSGWQALRRPPPPPTPAPPAMHGASSTCGGSHPHRRGADPDVAGHKLPCSDTQSRAFFLPLTPRPRHDLDALETSAGAQRLLRRHRGCHRLTTAAWTSSPPGSRSPPTPPAWPTSAALPDGTWTDWTMLGNPPGGSERRHHPGAGHRRGHPAGTEELFAVAVDSTIWHDAQTAAGDSGLPTGASVFGKPPWAGLRHRLSWPPPKTRRAAPLNVCLTHMRTTNVDPPPPGRNRGGAWTVHCGRALAARSDRPARSLNLRELISATPGRGLL